MEFPFHDLTPFAGTATSIKRPVEIADFSFDDQHVCHPLSAQSLRYYYPPFIDQPGVPIYRTVSLAEGFDQFIKRDDSTDLHLDGLLQTLEQLERRDDTRVDADFITWRGMMTKILAAPFDKFGDFDMIATRFQDTIYIEEDHLAKNASQRTPPPRRMQEMQYWGYKFEELSTLSRTWADSTRDEIEQRSKNIVDNHAQYCSVVRTAIGGNTIVIGGEVDAVRGCKSSRPNGKHRYVELKTTMNFDPREQRRDIAFRRKMCRMWAQSFLLGVPSLIVGFRNEQGELERIQEWDTMQIPNYVRAVRDTWDGNVCINFAAAFLSFLKREISGKGTWKIRRLGNEPLITVTKTSEEYPPGILYPSFKAHRESGSE